MINNRQMVDEQTFSGEKYSKIGNLISNIRNAHKTTQVFQVKNKLYRIFSAGTGSIEEVLMY